MQNAKGFTFIEIMITVLVLVIIITLAAPAFTDSLERRRLERAGEKIYGALHYARSESIKQYRTVRLSIVADDDNIGWCYGIDDDITTPCDCRNDDPDNPTCTVSGAQKIFSNGMGQGAPFSSVTLAAAKTISFTGARGFASANNITLRSPNHQYKTIVSSLGRVRVTSTMPGYPH